MSWTRKQFIERAFEEIGLAGYIFDLQPEQLDAAKNRLDSMMATWNGKGIRLGYPLSENPDDSNIDDDTTVPDSANEAIYTNLAIRLAPTLGKTVSQDTRLAAREGYETLMSRAAMPSERQLPSTMPTGMGNRPWNLERPFVSPPQKPINAGQDGVLELD